MHVADDSREPDMKKAAMRQPRNEYGCYIDGVSGVLSNSDT